MIQYSAQLSADLDEDQVQMVSVSFEDVCDAFIARREGNSPFGDWLISFIHADDLCDDMLHTRLVVGCDIACISTDHAKDVLWLREAVADKDWVAESYAGFKPFTIAPFFIYGSHYDGDVPSDLIPLQIDAATAFGTGEHGTTAGCLQAMVAMKEDGICPWNVLDMGTGSGILAIAAWKLWQTPILAVDNEEEAIVVTARHAHANGVAQNGSALSSACGDGYNTPEVSKGAPYDLIIANILAAPLIDMADQCLAVADDNAMIILSGMLIEQAVGVLDAYEKAGAIFIKQIDIGEWSTLVLRRA